MDWEGTDSAIIVVLTVQVARKSVTRKPGVHRRYGRRAWKECIRFSSGGADPTTINNGAIHRGMLGIVKQVLRSKRNWHPNSGKKNQ